LYCQLLKQSVASQKGEKVKPRIEVQVRLDFLALNPIDESPKAKLQNPKSKDTGDQPVTNYQSPITPVASASIPFKYISDPRQRIEIYRKLAQASDKPALQSLEKEIRDRFGLLPASLQLLLLVGELKLLASDRGVTAIEVKEDRLMLTRNDDYIMIGSKFPRLTKSEAAARLKEIKKLLSALS
jgi:transcription-repair coupling factor (superfamily II helicase)